MRSSSYRIAIHEDVKVIVFEGVYEPAEDTYLILDNLKMKSGMSLLDVGTGSGIIGIWAAKRGARVVATDRSKNALMCARYNALKNHVQIDVVQCDLAAPINGKFDIIAFNPPYLPFKDGLKEDLWWYGGKNVIERFLIRDLPRVLSPGGRAYIVYSSLTDMDKLEEILPKEFDYKIIKKERYMFEELYLVEIFW